VGGEGVGQTFQGSEKSAHCAIDSPAPGGAVIATSLSPRKTIDLVASTERCQGWRPRSEIAPAQ
jgi:hypothetical protein